MLPEPARGALPSRPELPSALLEHLSDGYARYDAQWRFADVNAAGAAMTGLRPEELLGRVVWDLFPDGGGHYRAAAMQARDRQELVVLEEEHVASGRWFRHRFCPAGDGVAVLSTEFSRERRRQEALAAAEERLRLALEAARMAVWHYDAQTGVLVADAGFHRLCGLAAEPAHLPVTELMRLIAPEDTARVEAELVAAAAGLAPFESEFRIRRADDGATRWFRGHGRLLAGMDGPRLTGVVVDVTDARRTREKLDESEALSATLLQVVPDFVVVVDAEGLPEFVNDNWVDYTGADAATLREAVRRGGLGQFVHPDERPGFRDAVLRAIAEAAPMSTEVRLRRRDGEYRWFALRSRPVRAPTGEITHLVTVGIDVEDHRRAETALREAVGIRDEFLSIASHELRTPLTALSLQVSGLLRAARAGSEEPLSSPHLRPRFDRLDRQLRRLAGLVEELLDVTRLANGRMPFRFEAVDLPEIVQESVGRFGDELQRRNVTLQLDVPAALRARGDRLRLDQVVTNLVSNAVRYGRGRPIRVDLRHESGEALLRVRDEGVGIAPADRARIFERFEQAQSALHGGGLGLGLYITREVVLAHGGRVEVESEPGAGSTFVVALPLGA